MTLSAVLKKELKQAFSEIKFSVTTSKMDSVSVKWELAIGTTATKNAVSEICKKHETVEHHGSSMDDTSWYSGTSVYVNPTCTQERKDWAVKATEARNFVGVVWNERYRHFEESDGHAAFHATKQYHEYCDNGITSEIVDKYGQEPDVKRWYYERLAREVQVKTAELEPEAVDLKLTNAPQETITPVCIQAIKIKVSIKSNFPEDTLKVSIDKYHSQPERDGMAKVYKLIELTPPDYQKFTNALLDRHAWLAGEGGNKARSHYYNTCVAVTDGIDYVLIDPQGVNYARCVGFGVDVTLEELLRLAQIQLFSTPALSITPENTPNSDPVIELYIELITAFKEVTFSVKAEGFHPNHWIKVEWEINLGTRATVDAVKAICKRYETFKHPESMWAGGVSIYCDPSYPQECTGKLIGSPQSQPEPEPAPQGKYDTNLIPFPTAKQSNQPTVRPEDSGSSDDFYVQNYYLWLGKLVARGEYKKVKSFDEWYAIVTEVM